VARSFNGSSSISLSSLAGGTGLPEMTAVAIAQLTSGASTVYALADSNSTNYGVRVAGTSFQFRGGGGGGFYSPSSTITVPLSTWCLFAITKTAGTTPFRFHLYNYGTDTWTRGNSSATTATFDLSATPLIGDNGVGPWVGDIAASAVFSQALTDDQIGSLPYALSSWISLSPIGMWVLDQQATTQAVVNWAGLGANQVSLTGTTVSTGSVPTLSYVHSVIARRRQDPSPAPHLAVRHVVPYSGNNSNTLTTPSITVSNGDVIVVKMQTWATATAMGSVTGGGQTWTSQVVEAPGGFNGWVGISTTTITGSPGSMTVSATPAASCGHSMVVERWTNAQLAATPAVGSGTAATSSPSATVTTTAANSVVSWLVYDNNNRDPAARAYLSSAVDEALDDNHTGTNGVTYYAYQQAPSAGSQTIGLSAPNTMQWVIAGIEIQAPSTGSGITATAGQAGVAADGYNPTAVTSGQTTAIAEQADVTAAGALPTAAVTAIAGQAAVGADGAGAGTVLAGPGAAVEALVAADATTPVAVLVTLAGQTDVAVDGQGPSATLAGIASADVALVGADAVNSPPAITAAADQSAVGSDGQTPSMITASNAAADIAAVDSSANNAAVSTSSSVTASAVEALVDASAVAPGLIAVQPGADAAMSSDGFNPTVVTVPNVVASAGSADVAADGNGATAQPVLTVTTGQADVSADAYGSTTGTASFAAAAIAAVAVDANGATASTSSNVVAGALEALVAADANGVSNVLVQPAASALVATDGQSATAATVAAGIASAGQADVGVDGLPAAAQPDLVASAGQAAVDSAAANPTASTVAQTTAVASSADVGVAATGAVAQPVLTVAADFAAVYLDGATAAVTTAASATAAALAADATAQAFNALVQVISVAAAGSAEVGVEAYGIPKRRRPGVLTPGATRSDPAPGSRPYPRLTAGTLRGPTYGGG
jgi:hypothetical protein